MSAAVIAGLWFVFGLYLGVGLCMATALVIVDPPVESDLRVDLTLFAAATFGWPIFALYIVKGVGPV